jgi:beta-phosphoglucomutase-like phosphatase (HAD superfamily)
VFEDADLGIEAAKKAGMNVTDVRSWYDSNW